MAEYYTKPEADALFALQDHNHNLEDLGGTELPSSRVAVPTNVSASFDDAFTLDEALASAATQLAGKASSIHTHSGYAPSSHTHEGYAETDHTHTPASIGAAPASHTHDYAELDHTHTPASIGAAPASHTHDYAEPDHTHTPASIGAAPASHTHDYAEPDHTHTQADISGLEAALAAKANSSAMSGKADLVDGKVPESQLPSFVSDVLEYAAVANFPTTGESGKIYVATGTNKSYRWSGTTYVEIAGGVALGETAETAYRGDRGKIAYDHSQDGTVHVTPAQKTAWDGKAAGDHTHTPAAIGAATVSHSHSYNDLTDKPTIPTTLPANGGNADTVDGKHADDFSLAGHIHSTTPVTTENEDLDNYNVAGVYSFAAAYQPVNRPEGTSNGWLVVVPWTSNTGTQTVKQFWLRHGTLGTNDHMTYVRTKVGDYGWSSWAAMYTTKNPPTAAEVGAAEADHKHHTFSSTTSASTFKLIYLSTTGDDDNTGFSSDVPMATIKGVIRKYSDAYKWLDIRLADGTYTENIGAIAVDQCNLSIRSVSEDKDKVTINMTSSLELSIAKVRLLNLTINVTTTGIRPVCVNAGGFYATGCRFAVPEGSTSSCINVYNGSTAFLTNCVLNAGTSGGACVYGNQALLIKAINCTSERTVYCGCNAYNGTDIIYTPTLTATTMAKESAYGKCTRRDSSNGPLWSGNWYMNSSQTVTPTKKLSECEHGWILLWSDYDDSTNTVNNADYTATVIPKCKQDGNNWSGQLFLCDVPRYFGSDLADVSTEKRIMKMLYVHDSKIVGHTANNQDTRTDVVLRAIYEF